MDFHWGDTTFNMEGGTTLALEELLDALAITGFTAAQKAYVANAEDEDDDELEDERDESVAVPGDLEEVCITL